MAKTRKILSLLCAASMAASVFSGIIGSAGAATETDILWSDTFNGQNTGLIADGTNVDSKTVSEWVPGLTFVTTNRGQGDKGSYTDSANNYVLGGSYYAVEEKEDKTDKYLRLSFPVFGDFAANGRWAHVDLGASGYAATADNDVVMDFDVKLTDAVNKGETINPETGKKYGNPVLRIGSFDTTAKTATAVEISKEALNISDGWVHARIVVSASTGAKLYIDKAEVASAAKADVKALNTIGLYSSDPQGTGGPAMADLVGNSSYDDGTLNDATKPTKTAIADIDNVIIYKEAVGAATGESKAPGAQDQQGGDATPEPTKGTTVIPAAPVLTAPTRANGVVDDSLRTFNFDSNNVIKWSLGTEDQDIKDIEGLNIHIGSRSNGGSVDTFAAVAKSAGGNVLQLQGGQYSHAGRGPRLNVIDPGDPEAEEGSEEAKGEFAKAFAEGKTLAMSFAVRLSAPENHEADAKSRLYLLKDANQAGEKKDGEYNRVAAVLTSIEGEEIKRGESDVISTYITPDEWHYVTFVISPKVETGEDGTVTISGATHRLYVDVEDITNAEPNVKCDYVSTGEAATYMSDLPMLTMESKTANNQNPDYSLATIDNLLVYYGNPSEPRRMCATAEWIVADKEITAEIDSSGTKVKPSEASDTAIVAKLTQNTDGTYTVEVKIGLTEDENTITWTNTPKAGDKIMVLCGAQSMKPAAETPCIIE